jgi:hypothetical protein
MIPDSVDTQVEETQSKDDEEVAESKESTTQYSYFTLLTNKRILFANLAVIVNILQYTFIDPILGDRMSRDFGYDEKMTALMFFFIAVGYTLACQYSYITLKYVSFRR